MTEMEMEKILEEESMQREVLQEELDTQCQDCKRRGSTYVCDQCTNCIVSNGTLSNRDISL